MTEEELRELFCDLRSSNITPLLCDTKVPLYGAPVPCGEPTYCPEDITDSVLLPKAILSMHPEFMIPVKGDSMRDAGDGRGIVKTLRKLSKTAQKSGKNSHKTGQKHYFST